MAREHPLTLGTGDDIVTTLTEFLEARLAEDEAAAQATLIDVHGSGDWRADERPVALTVDLYRVRDINARPVVEEIRSLQDDDDPDDIKPYVDGAAVARHVALHDPARVLREVAAKRRVMERHRADTSPYELYCGGCSDSGPRLDECPELRDLAAVYSDHPEFNQDWSAT